jgi:hypothetical protein
MYTNFSLSCYWCTKTVGIHYFYLHTQPILSVPLFKATRSIKSPFCNTDLYDFAYENWLTFSFWEIFAFYWLLNKLIKKIIKEIV